MMRPKQSRSFEHAIRRGTCLLVGLALFVSLGCGKKTPSVSRDLLMPLTSPTRWGPESSDLAAARLAEAALASEPAHVKRALADVLSSQDSHMTKGLPSLCQDLANTTLDDPIAYREASKQLRKQKHVDHALDARLKQYIANDALKLAKRRRLDTWETLFARTFNAVSEPLGRALLTGAVTAPFTIAQSGAHYLASFSNDEPLSTTHRQGLVLHKEYIAKHPEHEDADDIQRKIDRAELKLDKTLRKRQLRIARKFMSNHQYRPAIFAAERALLHGKSEKAEKILAEAERELMRSERIRTETLQAAAELDDHATGADATRLATALLASSRRPLRVSDLRTLRIDRNGPLAPELAFTEAIARIESGYEDAGRDRLQVISNHDGSSDPMAIHAAALLDNTREDPYLAFKKLKRSQSWALVRYRVFADWTKGTRYPNLPKSVAYLVESPGIAQTVVTTPIRLIFGTWSKHPNFDKPTSVAAYRYLGLEPEGKHQQKILRWLVDYEEGRGNAVAALRAADFLTDFDPERRNELLEKASEQALTGASRIRRTDEQHRVLREIAREFPDSEAGNEAGHIVREQLLNRSAQYIRVTKSFLMENPRVAGDEGLGIQPYLLNDDTEDGEIHDDGVVFLGGRRVMINLVDEDGDDDDERREVVRTVSERRLGRTAAMLDTTVRQNELIDPEERLGSDGDRDQFIERASLGLADDADERATARSTYVYRSMRERYGMVRGRESVLPVDLVFQGGFTDFNFAAFPRWRAPKKTPDAFLYR